MSHGKTQFSDLDRRRFLCHTWDGVTASLALALLPGRELFAASSFGDNPFTLGVASGDPTPDGIVLWTRLAPIQLTRPALATARSRSVASGHRQRDAPCDGAGNGAGRGGTLHLGDYTYEYAIGQTPRGQVPSGFEAETLDLLTYRLRHTLHARSGSAGSAREVPVRGHLGRSRGGQRLLGPGPRGGSPSPEFTARRAAAYQAYYEHIPINSNIALTRAGLRIYRRLLYGRLVEFSMLDDRQYRTDNPCGDGESLRCDNAVSGNYTMLGRTQEQWLARGLTHSDAMWNIVGQQLLLAELEHATIQPNWFWNDAWDGYPLARQRLLTDVVTSGVRNPVFLTGDWHSTFVHRDPGADAPRPALRHECGEPVRHRLCRSLVGGAERHSWR